MGLSHSQNFQMVTVFRKFSLWPVRAISLESLVKFSKLSKQWRRKTPYVKQIARRAHR